MPPAFTNIQWQTYMIFGTFCVVMTAYVFLLYPETTGKSLEEIDYVFEARVPAWRSADVGGTFEDRVRGVEYKREEARAHGASQGEVTHDEKLGGETAPAEEV